MALWGTGHGAAGEKKPVWLTPAQKAKCFATERGWELIDPSRGKTATATLTFDDNTLNADTVVIEGRTYTFQDTLTDANGNVHVGATAADSATNLANCINQSGGVAGTDYNAASTAINGSVSAVAVSNVVTLSARVRGISGNEIAVTGSDSITASAAKMSGGRNGSEVIVAIGGLASRLGVVVDSVVATNFATDLFETPIAHGLAVGDRVRLLIGSGGVLPTGSSNAVTYYVIAAGFTTTAFKLSLTKAGSSITITDAGTNPFSVLKDGLGAAQVMGITILPSANTPQTQYDSGDVLTVRVGFSEQVVYTPDADPFTNPTTLSLSFDGTDATKVVTAETIGPADLATSYLDFVYTVGAAGVHADGTFAMPNNNFLDVSTFTTDADFAATHTVDLTINGDAATQVVYSTDNDTTLALVATEIASHADVSTAVVTDAGVNDREIVITAVDIDTPVVITAIVMGGTTPPGAVFARVPETITINTTTYDFVSSNASTFPLTNGQIVVGADAATTRDNIIAAINGGTGAGTLYGAGAKSPHPEFTAVADGVDVDITAIKSGTAPNAYDTLDSIADAGLVWGGVTPANGTAGDDAAAGEVTITAGLVLGGAATIYGVDEATGLPTSEVALIDLNLGGPDENTDIEAAFNAGDGALVTLNQ